MRRIPRLHEDGYLSYQLYKWVKGLVICFAFIGYGHLTTKGHNNWAIACLIAGWLLFGAWFDLRGYIDADQ